MCQGNLWLREVWTSGPRSSILRRFASYALVMLFRDNGPAFLAPCLLRCNAQTDNRHRSSHLSNAYVPNALLSPVRGSTAKPSQSPCGQGLIIIPNLWKSKVLIVFSSPKLRSEEVKELWVNSWLPRWHFCSPTHGEGPRMSKPSSPPPGGLTRNTSQSWIINVWRSLPSVEKERIFLKKILLLEKIICENSWTSRSSFAKPYLENIESIRLTIWHTAVDLQLDD